VQVAKKLGVSVDVIEDSVKAREKSRKKHSYQGKVINALRNRFGGHGIKS
jgi:6-phosphogluconate dehydrogenase (decarboxylating)